MSNLLQLGGPSWAVKLGRRDAKTASRDAANSGVLPPPTSTLDNLITRFKAVGLSARDMVALSGNYISTSPLSQKFSSLETVQHVMM